jgi:phosphatidylethanolamine-binding protein (PEBP) family uncharacterized protein
MQTVARGSGSVGALACLSLLGLALAGCGSSGSQPAAVPSSPAASAQNAASSSEAVASVAGTPIPKASYEHWLTVERKLGGSSNASHRALAFLITSQWVVGEAQARHIAIPETQVKQRYSQIVHQSFPKAGSLEKFLSSSGESEADLLARIHVEALTSRISAAVTAKKSSSQRNSLLAAFEKSFHAHWKKLTTCLPAYVMEDCMQYKGAPEQLTSTQSSSSSSSSSASRTAEPALRPRSEKKRIEKEGEENSKKMAHGEKVTSNSAANASSPSGELPAPYEGEFAILSSAFGRNGAIPSEYTCAGKGISPPLEWQSVPKGAAALVLFVIDDNNSAKSGGQRWIVANIDPSSKGVAAGQTPAGGVVGTNTAGEASYSSICPEKGKTDTIEFVLYALKKKVNVSPGFQPSIAESQYGQGKLLMGSAAITYAVASH